MHLTIYWIFASFWSFSSHCHGFSLHQDNLETWNVNRISLIWFLMEWTKHIFEKKFMSIISHRYAVKFMKIRNTILLLTIYLWLIINMNFFSKIYFAHITRNHIRKILSKFQVSRSSWCRVIAWQVDENGQNEAKIQ